MENSQQPPIATPKPTANLDTNTNPHIKLEYLALALIAVVLAAAVLSVVFHLFRNPLKQNQKSPVSKPLVSKLICPSTPSSCSAMHTILTSHGASTGLLGLSVLPDSPIYALFSGELRAQKVTLPSSISKESFIAAVLTKSDGSETAIYYFKGILPQSRTVKKNDVIATTSAEPIRIYQNSPLAFQVIKKTDSKHSKVLNLKKSDFSQ